MQYFSLIVVILCLCIVTPVKAESRLRCARQEDCAKYDTFCEGPFLCNRSRGHCTPQYLHYNPCKSLQREAIKFGITNRDKAHSLSIICVNEIGACLEVYYCVNDGDCDDHLYCNGKERCVEGECKQASDLSRICKDCDETTKCNTLGLSALQEVDSDPLEGTEPATDATFIYLLDAVLAIVGLIIVGLLLISVYQWSKSK